jgi:hypothetical protein
MAGGILEVKIFLDTGCWIRDAGYWILGAG